MKGAIPVPAGGNYGGSFEVQNPNIVLSDDHPDFQLDIKIDSSIVYFKLDGAPDYFELVLDRNGNPIYRGVDYTKQEQKFVGHCMLPPQKVKFEQVAPTATIQTCRLVHGQTRATSIGNRSNWSPPYKINIQTYGALGLGEGRVSYRGLSFTGICSSTPAQTSGCAGIDLLIADVNNAMTNNLVIHNMPEAPAGTFSVDGDGNDCRLSASTLLGGAALSKSGTITKTGAKSFTFSMLMEDISTEVSYTATGSGSWKN